MPYDLNKRTNTYLQTKTLQEQVDFAKERGTVEHILNIQQMIEKAKEHRLPKKARYGEAEANLTIGLII